ncbi:hypothetical protein [Cryptosporangium arvum]|uniref:DUF4345 domain-containing protein n=1 Tax=Cryptosporangium arvum DSM 44712 TaxID=927661 RepID=A0A010YPK1_9ACTN|nr:hypothetical protein [Cryptosporangium arvum]EXG82120.1 hypothetical protein CryarDRAFT_3262 [Cryptosporangium arvum DSM 44712]
MTWETSWRWMRVGLILLAGLDGLVGAWQYFFPRSFFDDFPTVRLDPPYNEHLVADVGGLNLAIVTVLVIAAVVLEYKIVMAGLAGFAVYCGTHFVYHVTNFDGFPVQDAVAVGTGLGIEFVLTIALLFFGYHIRTREPSAAER